MLGQNYTKLTQGVSKILEKAISSSYWGQKTIFWTHAGKAYRTSGANFVQNLPLHILTILFDFAVAGTVLTVNTWKLQDQLKTYEISIFWSFMTIHSVIKKLLTLKVRCVYLCPPDNCKDSDGFWISVKLCTYAPAPGFDTAVDAWNTWCIQHVQGEQGSNFNNRQQLIFVKGATDGIKWAWNDKKIAYYLYTFMTRPL